MSEPQRLLIDLVVHDLNRDQAYALAELCKRIGWSDARALAVDDDEAYDIIRATDRVRSALEQAGVYVR